MEKLNAAITIESKPTMKSPSIMAEPTVKLAESANESKPTMKSTPIMAEATVKVAESANDQVRIVDMENYKEASKCIAEAFMDDDVAKYFIHTDVGGFKTWSPEDLKLHYSICEYITYAHCLKGLVTTTGPKYSCVALW